MLIRDATTADAAAIAKIYNHYIRNTTASFEEEPVDAAIVRRRLAAVRDAGLSWLVAETEGIDGYAYASVWNTRRAYRFTAEVTAYIDPGAAGQGIGSALYDALFERLREAGYRVVVAVITLPNPASVALHEKLGLRRAGLFAEVGFKFGRWIDVGYWHGTLHD